MVLFKKNVIELPIPPLLPRNLKINVWLISETGEWFSKYDEYLERMDFYNSKMFTCEITGQSQLSFFEAMNSEEDEFENLERKFPLKIREPIAKSLHFNQITRLDLLVEEIYNRFRYDYYPGESVNLKYVLSPTNRTPWIIKEKAMFPALINTETQEITRQAFSKYQIYNPETNESQIVDEDKISRDRSCFTKHLLRSFCKVSLYKPSKKTGCPWCVKPEYLSYYNLDMTWPKEFEHFKQPVEIEEENDESDEDTEDSPDMESQESGESGLEGQRNGGSNHSMSDLNNNGDSAVTHKKNNKKHTMNHNDEDKSGIAKKKKKRGRKPKNSTDSDGVSTVNGSVEGDQPDRAGDLKKEEQEQEEIKPVVIEKPVIRITTITEDFDIPFDHTQEPPFAQFQKLDTNLNQVAFNTKDTGDFKELSKLLSIYQFINTFNTTLKISLVSLKDLITTFKCANPQELAGETVHLELVLPLNNSDDNKDGIPNTAQRISKYDKQFFESKLSMPDLLRIVVKQDDPTVTVPDSLIDDIQYNGTTILVELFCALIRLFMDETGNWSCIVQDVWIEENDTQEKGKEHEKIPTEMEQFIDKVLEYKKMHWTERVTKRQFNNGNWLFCLIGIYQDAIHLPKYRSTIINIMGKIMVTEPQSKNSGNWNKLLWRNFVWKLSNEEKIQALWILTDLVLNYQFDIKSNLEISMDVVNNLKSERYKITKEYKSTLKKITELETKQEKEKSALVQHTLSPLAAVSDENIELVDDSEKPIALEIEKLTAELQELQESREKLEVQKNYWELQLRVNEQQRLRSLGNDKFGNTYWYLELCGINFANESSQQFEKSGQIFVQGPNKFDIEYHYGLSYTQYLENISHYKLHEDGSIVNEATNTVLKSAEGSVLVSYEDITNLERKIVAEGVTNLLIDDSHWAMITDSSTLNSVCAWLNRLGLRENQLKKGIENNREVGEECFPANEEGTSLPAENKDEQKLIKEIEDYQLNDEDKIIIKQYIASYEDISANNEQDSKTIDKELETIVQKIMSLEDSSSKTRTVLDEISNLEGQRAQLLKKRSETAVEEALVEKSASPETSNKNTNKLFKSIVLPKLEKLQDLFSELHNFQYSQTMEKCSNWENDVALAEYGKNLWKGANNSGREEPPLPTCDERVAGIQANLHHISTKKNY